jgi:hypothetical protein
MPKGLTALSANGQCVVVAHEGDSVHVDTREYAGFLEEVLPHASFASASSN